MRVITLTALCLALSFSTANAQIQPESITVETMATPGENWFISKTGGGAYIFDASSGEMHGLLATAGFQNPGIEPYGPREEFYAAQSYYSRGSHGDRTDVVTVYDFDNLSSVAEIEIPKKIAVLSMRGHMRLMNNGKHLGVFNMTPAQSVSIVDVEERAFIGEISTPGCAIMMPVAENDFLMLCGDGTLQLIQLDDDGNESDRIRSDQFFDVQEDPVYDRPVETGDGYWLVTHQGRAFDVSQDGSQISVSEPWSIVSEEDAEEKWLPGGGQLKTAHKGLGLGYILMHQGKEYTHHDSGTEIWVFDLNAKRRIARIELEVAAGDIMVTQEAEPLLLVADDEGGMHIYNAITMKHERTIDDSGPSPALFVDF